MEKGRVNDTIIPTIEIGTIAPALGDGNEAHGIMILGMSLVGSEIDDGEYSLL